MGQQRRDEELMVPMNETGAAGAYVTTAIQIPRAVHQLLRQMAIERASRCGGRVSVSGVLAEMALEQQGVDQRDTHGQQQNRHAALPAARPERHWQNSRG